MQLRTDLALSSMINSLSNVVLPAVDAADAPAREQLQIAIGLLSLMAARLPLEFDYDCDELKRLIDFTGELGALAPELESAAKLAVDAHAAQTTLERARTTPQELQRSIRDLRATAGALISEAYQEVDDKQRATLSALVLKHADAQLLRERAWLLPQGWESQPDKLPDIHDLLGVRAAD